LDRVGLGDEREKKSRETPMPGIRCGGGLSMRTEAAALICNKNRLRAMSLLITSLLFIGQRAEQSRGGKGATDEEAT
jgi:hypothetical protein